MEPKERKTTLIILGYGCHFGISWSLHALREKFTSMFPHFPSSPDTWTEHNHKTLRTEPNLVREPGENELNSHLIHELMRMEWVSEFYFHTKTSWYDSHTTWYKLCQPILIKKALCNTIILSSTYNCWIVLWDFNHMPALFLSSCILPLSGPYLRLSCCFQSHSHYCIWPLH